MKEKFWTPQGEAVRGPSTARLYAIWDAAHELVDDVRRRYPGEEFRCPHMRALDRALHNEPPYAKDGGQ